MNTLSSQENLKCSKHPNKYLTFIQVNQLEQEETKHILYCDLCILYDKKFQSPNYVYTQQIIEYSNNSQIVNWPPIDDDQLKDQIYKIQNKNRKQNNLECKINQFFDNLRAEIFSKIDSCQEKMISKAQEYPSYEDEILKKLQEIQMTDQFKSILLNQNSEIIVKEKQCRELINQVHSQKSNYTQQIQIIFDKLNQYEQLIDFETPNFMKKSILQLIENINFFNEDSTLNEQININNHNRQNYHIEQKVEKLIDLLSIKSNFLSDQFIGSIKKLLNQLSPLIDLISFDQIHQNNNKPIDFSKLCDDKMKIIRELTEYFTNQQINQNYIQQVKESNQFKQISQILNNKATFLSKDFIDQFENYIIDTFPFLNSINFNNSIKKHKYLNTFVNIEDECLYNVYELIEKKKQIEQNNFYYKSQSFLVNEQISQLKQFKKRDLDNLLQKYPIYDLLMSIYLLTDLQLIKSKFDQQQSQNQKVSKHENNSIQIISIYSDYGLYYSNLILDRNEKYTFRFQIKPSQRCGMTFAIGLIIDGYIDSNYNSHFKLLCGFSSNGGEYGHQGCGWGIDKKVKGDLSKLQEVNYLELRVYIKDYLLEVVDYPNYNHKYEITDDKKNNLDKYQNFRLGVYLCNEVEVTLVDANICEQFQN